MLEIFLLGEVAVRLPGRLAIHIAGQKEIALLAYLAHTGQAHGREALADLLWDADSTRQALSNLRTALARLRKQVGEYLIVTRKTLAVIPAVHEGTDTIRFQAMLASAGNERSATGANLLAQGLALYKGELMQGFYLPSAPRFNDWLLVEQERLHQVAMNGYRRLAGWQEEQGAFSAGVRTAQQWVAWDPLDETAQQQLMRLLAYDGRSSEALAVYERCAQLLQAELAIPPAPATTALYEAIRDDPLIRPDIASRPLHNLPRALAPLFGREEEITALTGYLVNPQYPLVSIIGLGGTGKTSLALATGRQLVAQKKHPFKDGIWFVALEEIENDTAERVRNRVAALVGQAMGLYFHGESDLWTQLLGQLASRDVLLILDNIEQFLSVATDLVVDLLEAGDGLHLLVTSRTTLALAASVAFPLAGLPTPEQVSPEALNSASVRLFAERATRAPGPFQLEKHLAEVVAICRFVEGIPLGIELAAASLGHLMIDEILPALDGNLRLLNSTYRDLPPRQRTLHALFDYTWNLLDPREQTLLAQLSIFRGGFTRQAAESVLDGASSNLYNLQQHALLKRDETGRFRMHPLMRQLAREKLDDPDRLEAAGQALNRHGQYYADLLQSFEDDLRRGLAYDALQTILPEQANLRAAWQYATQTGQWQRIADCLESVHYFHQRKGLFSEEAALVDDAIAALQASMRADDVSSITLLSRLMAVRARGYLNAAQFEDGIEAAKQACELAQSLDRPDPSTSDAASVPRASLEALARLAWARILSIQHKREAALAHYEQVVTLAKIAQDQIMEADGWIGIGAQLIWQSDVTLAKEPLHQALTLCQALLYKPGELEALILLGDLALRQEAYAESVAYDERALQLSRLMADVAAEAEVLGSMAVGLKFQGDLAASLSHEEEALAIFRRLNMPESEAWILGELGDTATRLGNYASAEQNLSAALTIARQLKDEFWQAWVNLHLGVVWSEQGKADKALPFIKNAFQTAGRLQNPRFLAAVLYYWGLALLNRSDWAPAEEKFQEAYDLRRSAGQSENALPPLAGLAYAAYRRKMPAVAAAHADQLWQAWQAAPVMAERADLKLYWMLGMVWNGVRDARAKDVWASARALLHARSETIPDADLRKMFLGQVPAHKAILEAAA